MLKFKCPECGHASETAKCEQERVSYGNAHLFKDRCVVEANDEDDVIEATRFFCENCKKQIMLPKELSQ